MEIGNGVYLCQVICQQCLELFHKLAHELVQREQHIAVCPCTEQFAASATTACNYQYALRALQ